MNNLKGLCIVAAISAAFASCKYTSNDVEQPPPTVYAPPVVQPLKLSNPVKINWDSIKAITVHPVVKPLDIDQLPAEPYDTAGFKPFTYPVEEAKFDYDALPENDLDIDKLPSRPLKFKTYILQPPKIVKAEIPELKKRSQLSIYEFGQGEGWGQLRVTCVFNDRDGFLWIAVTGKGLYRYDGENLLQYALPESGQIIHMLQDKQGQIWMSLWYGGIEVLDAKAGTLKRIARDGGLSNYNYAVQMVQDKQERIWLSPFQNGINIIDPKTQTIKLLDKKQGLSSSYALGLTCDHRGNIWIGTAGGIDIVEPEDKKIKHFGRQLGLAADTAGLLFCDHKGRVWIQLEKDVIRVADPEKNLINTIHEFQSPQGSITGFAEDARGRVWISTWNRSINVIDPDKRMVCAISKNTGLISDYIFSISFDNRGQVWAGTQTGLIMISGSAAIAGYIGTESTNCMTVDDDGRLWNYTNFNGVYISDLAARTNRHLTHKQGLLCDTASVISAANGKIFISSGRGLDIICLTAKTITHLPKQQFFKGSTPGTVLTDGLGRLWIGLYDSGGIDVYDPRDNTIKHIGREQGLSDGVVADMRHGSRQAIWVNTLPGGIDKIDIGAGTVQSLENIKDVKGNTYKPLAADGAGNIWIGTERGIYIADVKNKKIVYLSVRQGLINNKVVSLTACKGRAYAGFNQGLTVISPPAGGVGAKGAWKAQSLAFARAETNNAHTDAVSRKGFYLWGDDGVSILDVSKKDTLKPAPYILAIDLNDRPLHFLKKPGFDFSTMDTLWSPDGETHYLKAHAPANSGYVLQSDLKWDNISGAGNMPVNLEMPYDQNFLQFHFSSLYLALHDTGTYRYILRGVDKKWSDPTGSTASVNYLDLRPGNYTFEVISRSADGDWSKPATFSFTITPPWWQTWWAYILYVCLFAGTVWGFVYYRSLQLIKEKRILEHKVQVRTEEVLQQKEEIEAQRDSLEKSYKELKLTQTQLIQSEKMASLGELTAGIAHEIQNPLNFVNNFSEVNTELIDDLKYEIINGNIVESLATADTIQENQQKINLHGQRADAIVKAMLQHSRSTSGQKEPTNINALADEYLQLAYYGLRAKDKSFNAITETHFDKSIGELNINPQDIGRVILNLLNNAFYAVNEKKKLHPDGYEPAVIVSTKKSADQICISVRDNGNGIPQKILDKIYQPFFTTKPTGQGTGLGLSMSYDIIKAHGGESNVETEEGEFTEFIVSLPIN